MPAEVSARSAGPTAGPEGNGLTHCLASPGLESVQALIAEDMRQVDAIIQRHLRSDVPLIDQLGHHIVNSGGKRLRPAMLLLSAKLCAYQGAQHYNLAAIVEFIHTATLLHDDVVDASLLRRGQATANQCWGNEASVLVGDFVYSRAFQMMVEADSLEIMRVLADATNAIATGEVEQLGLRHNPDATEAECLDVIRNKTAKLFEAAAQLGAMLGGVSKHQEEQLAGYGRHVGTAFQLIDDVLDYSSSTVALGKNICDDLSEGKPTIPLLYAMRHGNEADADNIRCAIKTGRSEKVSGIQTAIHSSGALEYTLELARREVDMACDSLSDLPASPYSEALCELARFALQRNQ